MFGPLLFFLFFGNPLKDNVQLFTNESNQQLSVGSGLRLPAGFSATVMADSVGKARHIIINKNGVIYVKLSKLLNGKGILRLQDSNSDGIIDNITGFGNYIGTGITIKNGYLYASSNAEVFRYKLDSNEEVISPDEPEKIITGLINGRQHNTKSLALDNNGNIYVNIGSPSNSCQEIDRGVGSKGKDPCPVLDSAGGIWQFKADKLNQTYKDGVRYATGLRNVMGLKWNEEVNELFVVQHGRDQLDMFPEFFTPQQNAVIPAEEMFMVKKGDDCGWPYCYFDVQQNKKVLAPEYGGDGKKTTRCEGVVQPIVAFPAHMAPNDLLFYTGNMFPAKYKNGAFVAFHGSWNRSPEKQEGYYVVFVPFKDGKPNAAWEVFADGFSGVETVMSPRQAQHRPCGLAMGPDGALYVTDDVKGKIYKITYQGN
ncbi:sorbosone dehydrogenase [Lacibacter luteus]|uniref:Sorbosone dehydrogenase n=2 Tax=Lacibacter luteus TaxID=2508719 RepID=A0A4V1M873_9BACT|nr:sorbosone dehydrogenase [Lacibacter luteus]